MKFSSKKIVLLSTAVCAISILASTASANKSVESKIAKVASTPSYSVNGKMNKKTAMMLINLLRNPHLQMRAEVNGQRLQTISPRPASGMKRTMPMDTVASYTITGKTTRANVLRFKQLMMSNQRIVVSARTHFDNTPQFANTAFTDSEMIAGN